MCSLCGNACGDSAWWWCWGMAVARVVMVYSDGESGDGV